MSIGRAQTDLVSAEACTTECASGRNVAALAKPPSVKQTRSHAARDCWDEQQLRRFLEHTAEDRLYACWRLMSATGARRGEVVGLRR